MCEIEKSEGNVFKIDCKNIVHNFALLNTASFHVYKTPASCKKVFLVLSETANNRKNYICIFI